MSPENMNTPQWRSGFCHAEHSTRSTRAELLARLTDPIFREAIEVLWMIARNPEERRFYDERLKMELDERARLMQAREDGIEERTELQRRLRDRV
jgi:hypothetical protein